MRFIRASAGTIVVLFGILFTLQGLGIVGGSGMSGKTLWAILGPIIAVAGLVVIARAFRPSQSQDLT